MSNDIDWHISRFAAHWNVDVKQKRIFRRQRRAILRFWELIHPPKFQVMTIYRGLQSWASTTEGIVFSNPIDRDRMTVDGHPEKFVLLDGWEIADEAIRFLTGGPLVYQGSGDVVVPANRGIAALKSFAREWGPIIGLGTALVAVLRFSVWLF